MKKIALVILVSLSYIVLPACNNQAPKNRADKKNVIDVSGVPAAVQDAFNARYPGVREVIWEKAHEGNMDTYKVKFKKRLDYLKAEYAPDGNLIKVETDD